MSEPWIPPPRAPGRGGVDARVVVAIVAVLLVVIVALVLTRSSGSDDERSDRTTTTRRHSRDESDDEDDDVDEHRPVSAPPTTILELSESTLDHGFGAVGDEMDRLVAAGRRASAHVRYTVQDPTAPGRVQTVETWRSSEGYRYEQSIQAASGTTGDQYVDDGTSYSHCSLTGGRRICDQAVPKTAGSAAIGTARPSDLARTFIFKVTDTSPAPTLTTAPSTIAELPVTCFRAAGVGELCLSEDGVVLRLKLGDLVVSAADVDDQIPAGTFRLS